jgi:nitroreductase
MELNDVMRTTAAIREFTDEPVGDEELYRILDAARFAPSGGNRQGWRAIVVRDPELRRRLRDLYATGWKDYLALGSAGLVAWSPLSDRDAEREALTRSSQMSTGEFVDTLDSVPVLLVVFADLGAMAAVDRDHDRYTFAGGASVYPFVWNVMLAARAAGLGGVTTTMLIREEAQVRDLLGVPPEYALASVLALGHPVKQPTKLRRAPVEEFTTVDRFDGPSFT